MNHLKNKVQLIGHLGANPEIIKLKSGKSCAKLLIATKDVYKSERGEVFKETQWHQVIAWEGKAKIAEYYLTTGDQVCIEGRINSLNYTDKQGIKRNRTEVICQKLVLIHSKSKIKKAA